MIFERSLCARTSSIYL